MIETRNEEMIKSVISSFTRDNDLLYESMMQLQYYWRGALSREDILLMSPVERERASEFLEKRFEDASKMMKNGISVFL